MADLPPLENSNLRFILVDSYCESTDRPGGKSTGRSTPPTGNLRFILIDFYSESSGRPSGRSTPLENSNLIFILVDSYCESTDRPGGRSTGRSTPINWQFEIHTDRFLLWELRQTRWQINWQIYPLGKWQFVIHTDRFLFWELRLMMWQIKWQIYHPQTMVIWDSYW